MFTFLLSLMCAFIVGLSDHLFSVNKARFFDAVTLTQRLMNVIAPAFSIFSVQNREKLLL
ncbi:hypothetical protein EAKF1_ch2855 [Escherichia albertii KF1]|nr:hypothetical protein EAKF1_ch2855 [Escherichia albertii KF1]